MKRLFACALLVSGCGWSGGAPVDGTVSDSTPLVRRTGTLVVEGCSLETWQEDRLASADMRRLIQEIVFLCLSPRVDGTVAPTEKADREALAAQVQRLQGSYRVTLGGPIAFAYASPDLVDRVAHELVPFALMSDGIELTNLQRDSGAAIVDALAGMVRPMRTVGVFLPPLLDSNDGPNSSFDTSGLGIEEFSQHVDHLRVMTLDFSSTPGPTIDPGWAVDVMRHVGRLGLSSARFDIAYPLYGTQFSQDGTKPITYTDAMNLVGARRVERGPTLAPHFSWSDDTGGHDAWWDDSVSTLHALHAWDASSLPRDVGVLYYGFGAEDPTLFHAIAEATP